MVTCSPIDTATFDCKPSAKHQGSTCTSNGYYVSMGFKQCTINYHSSYLFGWMFCFLWKSTTSCSLSSQLMASVNLSKDVILFLPSGWRLIIRILLYYYPQSKAIQSWHYMGRIQFFGGKQIAKLIYLFGCVFLIVNMNSLYLVDK